VRKFLLLTNSVYEELVFSDVRWLLCKNRTTYICWETRRSLYRAASFRPMATYSEYICTTCEKKGRWSMKQRCRLWRRSRKLLGKGPHSHSAFSPCCKEARRPRVRMGGLEKEQGAKHRRRTKRNFPTPWIASAHVRKPWHVEILSSLQL